MGPALTSPTSWVEGRDGRILSPQCLLSQVTLSFPCFPLPTSELPHDRQYLFIFVFLESSTQ